MICPVNLRPCIDDLCHVADCIRGGGEMLTRCQNCHAVCETGLSGFCDSCDRDDDGFDDGTEFEKCTRCRGLGYVEEDGNVDCSWCGGSGYVEV